MTDILHEGIYTFMDCPYRKQIKDYDDGGMLSECNAKKGIGTVSCEYNIHHQVRICPEGYVQ